MTVGAPGGRGRRPERTDRLIRTVERRARVHDRGPVCSAPVGPEGRPPARTPRRATRGGPGDTKHGAPMRLNRIGIAIIAVAVLAAGLALGMGAATLVPSRQPA